MVEHEVEPRAVAAAVRTVLEALVVARSVVLLIDDARWLDEATALALGHALRRLSGNGVRVIATASPEGRRPIDSWLVVDEPAQRLAPLDAVQLRQVVANRLGPTPHRSTEQAVAELAGATRCMRWSSRDSRPPRSRRVSRG